MKKEEKIAKKRKEREKKSKVKILLRREAIRKERKEESKKYMLEKLVQPKQNPIIKDEEGNRNHSWFLSYVTYVLGINICLFR